MLITKNFSESHQPVQSLTYLLLKFISNYWRIFHILIGKNIDKVISRISGLFTLFDISVYI